MKKDKISIQESILWNSVGSIVYLLTQWLITILVVRIAGVSVAGDLTLAMSVNNIFYSISMFGMRNYQVTDVREKYKNGTYISSRLLSCSFSLAMCIGYCVVMGYSLEQKRCIIVYCIFKMSESLYDVYGGICQKMWRMDYIGKSWMLKGILTFLGFCGVIFVSGSLFAAVFSMVFLSMLVIVLYDIPNTKKLTDTHMYWQRQKIFELLKECFPLLCYSFMATAVTTLPRIIMERMLGKYYLGIYGSVAAPTLIVQMGASYIFNPFMTVFAEQYEHRKKQEFWGTLKKCGCGIGLICVAALLGGKILGKWGLNLLYGEEISAYVELLLPLIGCTILTAVVWLLCGLLTVVRDFRGLIVSNIVALAFSSLCSFWFIRSLGMQGASAALIVSLLAEAVCLFAYFLKKTRTHFKN